jgi:hypothetical protein
MGVHIREIYPGKWYLRITYKNIRKTKAAGSKERAIDLKKKLTTALDMLDYSMIKRWVIRMSGKYSKDTVRLMIAVLRVMMQEAVNEGLIVANPVAKLGKEGKGKDRSLHDRGAASYRNKVQGEVPGLLSFHPVPRKDGDADRGSHGASVVGYRLQE